MVSVMKNIMMEIIRELAAIKETSNVTDEQVLSWSKRVEALRVQKALLEACKEKKESKKCYAIRKAIMENNRTQNMKISR